MKRRSRALTLVELLISLVLVGLIAAGSAVVLHAGLRAHEAGSRTADAVQDGVLTMARITAAVRQCRDFSVTSSTQLAVTTYALAVGLPGDSATTATFTWDSASRVLSESRAAVGTSVALAAPVAVFSASDIPAHATRGRLLWLSMEMLDANLSFSEYVYPRAIEAE